MNEEAFQAKVLELAELLGWRIYHTRDSRGSHDGFPDLTLARADRLVFAELKTEKGRVRPAQEAWLVALAATGVETYLWRPSDWDLIVATLTRRDTPREAVPA